MRLPGPRLVLLALALPTLACERRKPTRPRASVTTAAADAGAPQPQPAPAPADVSAPPADAERLPGGVVRKVLARGTGTTPFAPGGYADLRYAGWERNGRQFEGTALDGAARRFDPKELVAALQQELETMVEGDRRRLWVPAALAYGKRTNFANAPKGDMTFEVELVRVVPVPATPPDVAAAPKGATTTKSGLAYVVLKKGTGKAHPTAEARAEVIYCAWKPNGELFQTSILGGDSIPVRVRLLPPGWREAMLKMVEGDKWRLWLPGKLAFGELAPGQEPLPFGPPPGPVVFDVELLKLLPDEKGPQ